MAAAAQRQGRILGSGSNIYSFAFIFSELLTRTVACKACRWVIPLYSAIRQILVELFGLDGFLKSQRPETSTALRCLHGRSEQHKSTRQSGSSHCTRYTAILAFMVSYCFHSGATPSSVSFWSSVGTRCL